MFRFSFTMSEQKHGPRTRYKHDAIIRPLNHASTDDIGNCNFSHSCLILTEYFSDRLSERQSAETAGFNRFNDCSIFAQARE